MKSKLLCILLTMFIDCACADPMPFEYMVTDSFGQCLFVMACRQEGEGNKPHGAAYNVQPNGKLRKIWQVEGWYELPQNVFISTSGRFLVRIAEPPEMNGEDAPPHLGDKIVIYFYTDGKLVRTYRLSDIVTDVLTGIHDGMYRKTFIFRKRSGKSPRITRSDTVDEVEVLGNPATEVFLLETVEGKVFVFKAETGKLLVKKLTPRANQ